MSNQENKITPANLNWDDTGNPYSKDYQDIFYSRADALAESSYIFLEANNLAERWQNLNGKSFIIGECGFGGGLNFLNTCKLWSENFAQHESAPINSTLYYLACDLHPFNKKELTHLHQKYPELTTYSDALLQVYPPLLAGIHSRYLILKGCKVVLILMFGDTRKMLEKVWQANGFRVDAWYLDGFSPALNADMWDEPLCSALADLSKVGTTLSTYSAAGLVKKSLRKNDFTIERKTGFANKRHMLVGKYNPTSSQQKNSKTMWFQLPSPEYNDKKAIVIGGGLAGCSTAYELAQTGWQVTLIEREQKIASKASGNPRGIVYCKLSNSTGASADYYLHSYLFALEHYQQFSKHNTIDWTPCGLLQIAYNPRELTRQNQALKKHSPAHFIKPLNALEATEIAGINLDSGGLFFPESGFLNPQALCHAYTQHTNITCITNTKALELSYENNIWHVQGSRGNSVQAPIIIIANSHDAHSFQQTQHYPLLRNFGQIDEYPTTKLSRSLSCVLCAKGYILPANTKVQFIGGITKSDEILVTDRNSLAEENLDLTSAINSDITEEFKKIGLIKSRTGVRCSSPDYLPLVGPVENKNYCQEVYKALRRNAKKDVVQEPV
ncbi:bifunctional tRNA (5-methylaminomethyl-2-thiouridine)(34)-methyltransferase MnmD/FAD-dependent 5-carboxymethylaminomethyl-2-thiouridine(34) oxidoreductase MnmC, partial [Gammaproteobacteria bacterium AH-315-E17]|nr:bifunctional tRNA (5-methylaminomethyl-2-thiouridine)(34)-methyltransferase MnmD/FAD-dependent 5-carboxymethylaminomethyl-2-thiouridine(34) oxidoreductase MnmC [Gammaproteobacteria bacterium AH-315-E17]